MPTANELTINTGATAQDMADAIFGEGVSVVSATYTGAVGASGVYSDGIATLGELTQSDTGVILSTGNVADFTNSTGTADTNTAAGTSTDHTGVGEVDGDTRLDAVSGQATEDGAFFDATFTSTGDLLTMQFVFTSEEYLEYVNGGVNDAIGVWVNDVYVPLTLADDSTTNVTIDTVNNVSNSNLYLDNPADQDPYNTEMDGGTVVMSLTAPVNTTGTNTIRIGIGDGGDSAYDSNLLIMGNSIQSVSIAESDQLIQGVNATQVHNLLANDINTTSSPLTITHINNVAVNVGDTVTLPSGEQITLNADGTVTILTDADIGTNNFTYSTVDANGNPATGMATIETSTTPPNYIVEGTGGDDTIDGTYTTDPEFDQIDENDNQTATNADSVEAGGGNDYVDAGQGDDTINLGDGEDTVVDSAGNDLVSGGEGRDTFDYTTITGNDTIVGGELNDTTPTNSGDKIDAHNSVEDLSVVFDGDESGLVTASGGTVEFTEIEHILGGQGQDTIDASASTVGQILDGGENADTLQGGSGDDLIAMGMTQDFSATDGDNDLLILENGFGNDTIEGFETPTDLGGGAYSGNDQVDVSNLTDGLGNPVNTSDVILSDTNGDGTGDAILTFPGGESITLQGVAPSEVTTEAQLVAIGIPPAPNYIVEGDAGDNFIDDTYLDDPQGDRVDNNDAIDGSNDDSIVAGAGNDTVVAGDGADTVQGDAGNDSLMGGAGDDSLQGGDGSDTLEGGDGNDVLLGGVDASADSLVGGAGNDTLNGEDGADTLAGGTGDDVIFAGTGDDSIVMEDGFGNDVISGGSAGETAGDTLDLSAVTTDTTVDLTAANPEDGTVSDGTSTATFDDIENIVLGGGRDTIELADGSGADTVQAFDMNDSGDGTTNDQLDVSGLTSDGGTTPVHTGDVVVTDTNGDGTGDAILTFPGGESITLVGVSPDQVDTADELAAIGIPMSPDFIVEGTSGGDLIDAGYTGDPEGDKIDANDHSDGSNNDSVQAGGGNDTVASGLGDDTVDAGDGDDLVYGAEGNDSVLGGIGNDSLFGEGDADTLDGGAGADSIDGGIGDDSLLGGSGTDTLLGGDGNDTLDGGDDADFVNGGFGDDLVLGGAGDDTLEGWFGNDTIDGGAGNDFIDADNDSDSVSGGDGNDTILGGFSVDTDTLEGGAGNDSIDGQAGDDLIYGGTGADVQLGSEGDDTFFLEDDFGADTITGGEFDETNGDTLDMSAVTQNTTVDLTDADPEAGTVSNGTDTASFTEIENIVLGGGRDTVVLADGSGDDTVQAFDMTDSGDGTTMDQLDVSGLNGLGGLEPVNTSDVTVTDTNGDGTGDAILTFPNGESITLVGVTPDQVDTPAELEAIGIPGPIVVNDNIVSGTSGDDIISAGYTDTDGTEVDGNDALGTHGETVGSNADSIQAGAGNDSVDAGAGDDTVDGGIGADTLEGGIGADLILGGDDNDLMYGQDGADTLDGGAGDDFLSGGADADSLTGGAGNDDFDGGDGNDTIIGGIGNDNMDGQAGDDSMSGGTGNDSMWGGTGNDTLDGGDDNDAIYAGAGDDSVDGGAGIDYIELSSGADTVNAGDDQDNINVLAGSYVDGTVVTVDGGAGGVDDDTLNLGAWDAYRNLSETADSDGNSTSGSVEVLDASGNWVTFNFVEIENLILPATDLTPDFIVEGDAGDNLINAAYTGDPEGDLIDAGDHSDGSDADSVVAGAGNDTVFSGAGDDTVQGDGGADELHGDAGNDILDGGADNDSLFGGEGNDTMLGGIGDDSMEGWLGDDSMLGGDGNDYIDGAQGNDTLEGGAGNDTLLGGSDVGNDSLDGGAGNDSLSSGDGDDTLAGGTGDDSIFGGGGDDIIVMEDGFGNDTIHGWTGTETDGDTLDLSAVTSDLTVDLTASDPEAGSISDGTSTATFLDIENIVLGGGRDTLELADGGGADSVEAFDMTDSGDGTTNDQLDVSALTSDGGTTPVTTDDVTVTDTNGDGTGDAILTFPGGESITLVGVTPDQVDSPAELQSIGIPAPGPNFIVEGTGGDDDIDASYVGDPEGDMVDNNDHSDGSNADSIQAGDGNDTVNSGDGNDTIDAGTGDDLVFAGAGDDTILGQAGADTLNGMSGDDLVDGGADNDSLVAEDGSGNDTIIGGETGLDEDELASFKTGDVVVDLTAGGTAADSESGTLVDGADTITFSEIETITLAGGNDSVIGSDGNDSVATGSGADTVDGGAGDDSFDLGGADGVEDVVVFSDGDGNDTVDNFETPTDNGDGTFTGLDQLDVSDLTDDNGAQVNTSDVLVTDTNGDGTGDAILNFPNGETITLVGVTPAEVNSPAALEAMGIPAPDYVVSGTGGDDIIDTGYVGDPEGDMIDDNDALDGSQDDVVQAGAGNDSVVSGAGDDEVFGADGADTLIGGDGNDTLDGDDVFATGGADSIDGGAGNDQLIGDAFDDTLLGGTGNDTIFAGDDNDLIDGGADDDQIFGQSGDDTIVVGDGFGNDTVVGGETGETNGDLLDASTSTADLTLDLSANGAGDPESGTLGDGTDTLTFSEIENIELGAGNDTMTGSTGGDNVDLNEGDDVADGGAGDDTITGGTGADTIAGGEGDDFLTPGPDGDRDVLQFADGSGNDTVSGFDLTDSGDGTTIDQVDVSGLNDAEGNPVNVADVVVTDTNGDGTGDAILTFPNGESITLVGVTPDQVDSPAELQSIGIPCFTPGTMIATLLGTVAVEDLKPGDLVLTADNGFKPVQWVGAKTLTAAELEAHPELKPVVLRKGAFGNGRKMSVSPQHGMIIRHNGEERLIRAKHAAEMLGGQYARIDQHCEEVTYIHIMFDQHELVFAEGTKSESFFPGPMALRSLDNDAARELLKLFPELAKVAAETQTTASAYGASVRPYLKRKELEGSWEFRKSDTLA